MKKIIAMITAMAAFSLCGCASTSAGASAVVDFSALLDSGEWGLAGIVREGTETAIDRTRLGDFSGAFTLRVARADTGNAEDTENTADGAKTGDSAEGPAEDPAEIPGENRYVFSGMGAPNRFMMPVTVDAAGNITALPVRATLMAAFRQPDMLTETDYLRYIGNVTRVRMPPGKLVLETTDEAGKQVVLTFTPLAAGDDRSGLAQ
jgi:heat shock protein HslJ